MPVLVGQRDGLVSLAQIPRWGTDGKSPDLGQQPGGAAEPFVLTILPQDYQGASHSEDDSGS